MDEGLWRKVFSNAPNDAVVFWPTHPPTHILVKPLIKESLQRLETANFNSLPPGIFPVSPVKAEVSVSCSSGAVASASMVQFPLVCADAFMIHKLQGQTCDFPLYLPRWSHLKLQHAYVAITRVRSLANLYFGQPLSETQRRNWKLPLSLEREMLRLQSSSDELNSLVHHIQNGSSSSSR